MVSVMWFLLVLPASVIFSAYSLYAQVCVRIFNGKQGYTVSVSNDIGIHALILLCGLDGISMVGILGDAHTACSTGTHKHKG